MINLNQNLKKKTKKPYSKSKFISEMIYMKEINAFKNGFPMQKYKMPKKILLRLLKY